jgi:Flp pilus assembly protein TadB
MPILLARTIEFVHIEQVSTLFTFRLGKALLYIVFTMEMMGLLWWNTGNNIHFAELHITKTF